MRTMMPFFRMRSKSILSNVCGRRSFDDSGFQAIQRFPLVVSIADAATV